MVRSVKFVNINGKSGRKGKHQRKAEFDFDKSLTLIFLSKDEISL